MRYLFGDSTDSNLEFDYLAYLRDAIDFAVQVLQANAGVTSGQEKRGARERAAEEAASAIEELGRAVARVTEPHASGDAPLSRCAAAIAQAAAEAVKREVARVRAGLGSELQQTDEEMSRLRNRTAAALAKLLVTHDLPDASESLSARWSGVSYDARLRQLTDFGLDVTLALDVAATSLFAHDLRVDKVVDAFEVHAPETAGWLKKEVKMLPHKIGRYHVAEVTSAPDGISVLLRATPEAGAAGFDVTVAGARVELRRVAAGGEAEPSFTIDERDVAPLRNLAGRLDEGLRALRQQRGALVAAQLDGKPLSTLVEPRALIERLIHAMAPVVREIAMRSRSPHELVLRRLLGGNRREEIFLSRSELVEKIETLPVMERRAFAALGLDEAPAAAAEPRTAPPPSTPPAVAEAPPAAEPVVAAPAAAPAPEPAAPARRNAAASTPPPAAAPPEHAMPTVVFAPTPNDPPPAPVTIEVEEPTTGEPAIEIEADLPPPPSPMSAPLPRLPRKTLPPPAPPPPASTADSAVVAAVEAALRDLEDQEPTEVVKTPPRPPGR